MVEIRLRPPNHSARIALGITESTASFIGVMQLLSVKVKISYSKAFVYVEVLFWLLCLWS